MGVREPEVGEILLFCVDDAGVHKKYRPFLVVSVVDGDSCSGEVFGDPLLDSKTKWALRLFQGLRLENRTQWVAGSLPGDEVGQWHFREQAHAELLPAARESFQARGSKKLPTPLSQVKGLPR